MTTAALAKIKCPEALSWNTLAQVCRLCLRNQCIKFDIFEDEEEDSSSAATTFAHTSLHERIRRFYSIQVTKSEQLPTKICHDCLFQMEIHSEFRSCVLQNEERLREFAGGLFPKEEENVGEEEREAGQENGIPEEFTEKELQSATVIDPNQVYVSSSDEDDEEGLDEEDNEEDDDDDDEEEEEGEITGIYQHHLDNRLDDELDEEGEAILLSDDDEEDHSLSYSIMPGILGPHQIGRQSSASSVSASAAAAAASVPSSATTSILEQQLMQGLAHHLTQQHHQPEQKTFFLCQFCDLGFKFQENCTEHELTKHDASFPYNCIYCLFSSDQRVVLQQHLRDEHGMQKPFLCTECKKGFTRRSDLRKHTIVHTGVRPYTCQVCQKSFSRNTNLTKHMRIHAGLKPFVCAKCPRTFVTGSDLVRHQRIHDGVKPFQCSVCPSTFARRDKLINHQNMHIRRGHLAGGDHFQGNNNNNNNNNNNHHFMAANVPAPFSLPTLPSLPPSVPSMADNNPGMVIDLDPLTEMRSANGMDMSQRILEAALMRGSLALTTPNHFGTLMNLPEQLFAADPTPSPASEVLSLQQQLEQQSFPPVALFPSLPPPPPPTSAQSSTSSGAFPQGNHRGGGGEGQTVSRPFVCLEPLCGKRFPRKGELERHETVHSGAKPFGCPMCDKRFSRKDKLVRHRRTHLMAQNNGEGVNGQQRSQAMEVQRTELPQISFTAALENFRRTEFINSQAPSMGGGVGAGGGVVVGASVGSGVGGGGGQREVQGGMEAKDFLFRPNFYSQINIGEETGTLPANNMEMRAMSPGTMTGQDIKREF